MTCLGRCVRYSAAYPMGAERVFRGIDCDLANCVVCLVVNNKGGVSKL